MKDITEQADNVGLMPSADTSCLSIKGVAAANDADKTDKLHREQLKEVYTQTRVSLPATSLVTVIVSIALWHQVPTTILLVWSAFAVGVLVFRGILSYRFLSTPESEINSQPWEKAFIAGIFINAAIWASLTLMFLDMTSALHIGFLIFVVCGMATAAVATLSAIVVAYRIFSVVSVTPIIFFLFSQGGDIFPSLGIMMAIYLLVLLRTVNTINKSYIKSLKNSFDNIELVQALSASKEEAEKTNMHMHGEIMDRKLAEEALFRQKEQLTVTLESIGDGVITTDNAGIIKYMNPFAEKFTGWTLKEASGQHLDQVFRLFDEETRLPIQNVYDFSMGLSEINGLSPDILLVPRASKIEFSISIDSEYSIEITASRIRDRKDYIIGTVLVFHDVTEMKGMAKQLSYHATHDSLTGLMNRREFENEIDHAITSAQREQIEHVLMYLDLDQFKIVNDTCGHLAGDELLKQISMLLHGIIRNVDTISRLGGDEFGVLLLGCGLDNATRIAEKLRQSVKDYKFAWQGKSFDIGASIGLVAVTSETTNKAEALSAADSACYVAKDQGRNRIHIYLPDDESIALRQGELMWIQKIKDAISDDRLCLYYQPVMPLNERKNAKVYCEFLLGMIDKNGKMVPPMAFIPAAERYQIMSNIDRWVIQTILRMAGEKHDIFERYDIFAINLSGQSLCDKDFLDFILVELADQAIDPTKICFEITETAAIANFQMATHFISKLRDMGCSFALDDFGSGLSSFAYLKKLNVDYLKIDGSFVKDLHEDPVNHAMVQAINQLGHVMGKKTIAEFVENKSLISRLRKIGVDYAQGYGVKRPQLLDLYTKPQTLKNFKA